MARIKASAVLLIVGSLVLGALLTSGHSYRHSARVDSRSDIDRFEDDDNEEPIAQMEYTGLRHGRNKVMSNKRKMICECTEMDPAPKTTPEPEPEPPIWPYAPNSPPPFIPNRNTTGR